jgi:GNAT superfamily N-acetyltransferase/RimJ/RimL family protein N-acetyltransferase
MSILIRPLDVTDTETVRACLEVQQAATEADDPSGPPLSLAFFRSRLASGWSGAPAETWIAVGETSGTASGWYRAEFPDLENQDRTGLELVVRPDHRRRGLGAALLRHAGERAAASGRAILNGEVQDGSAGETFALRAGATLGQESDVRRVLELAKIPAGSTARLRDAAAKAAAGYSLVRWEGVTPDERLEQMAALQNAMNDAPRDAGVAPSNWDAQRVRTRMNARIARSPSRRYSLAAVRDATGEMAALTVVSVDPDVPDWGHQLITAVTRPHRGHRLGLLTKAAMMDWLAAAEPGLERIVTWNAASNKHMIAINEELGYEVRGGRYRSAELPVASVVET